MGFLAFDRASLFFHFVSDIRWEERSLEAWQDGIKLRSCFGGRLFLKESPGRLSRGLHPGFGGACWNAPGDFLLEASFVITI